ncbi:MAG: pyridoxal phosphate-dependent aminotransferase [Planctomycetota bacterium]|jgi:aspartate aminotransferase
MPSFSHHAGALAESETLAITAKAKQMRANGVEVAPFAAGEPDFDTPEHIKEAGIAAIRDGRTKYAPAAGIAPLREAVAAEGTAAGYPDCRPENTMISVGAKGVIYLALQVLLEDGDEVIVPAPGWLSYPKMVQAAGAKTVFVETRPADRFAIDPDRIRAAITPRTKALVLNSPGNPTGAVQPDAVQREIGRLAVEHDITILSDEIYEHLTYAPARFTSFAALAPEAAAQTLIVNGVSKAYAMTGWRIGYAFGPVELIQRMVRLQSHAMSGPPEISQRAALAALEGPKDEVAAMCRAFAHRRDVMVDTLQAIEGVTCRRPEGAFYVLPDVSPYLTRHFEGEPIGTVTRLSELLLEEARAAVVPGSVFEAPYAIRFSYACSEADIREGVDRVATFLRELT